MTDVEEASSANEVVVCSLVEGEGDAGVLETGADPKTASTLGT